MLRPKEHTHLLRVCADTSTSANVAIALHLGVSEGIDCTHDLDEILCLGIDDPFFGHSARFDVGADFPGDIIVALVNHDRRSRQVTATVSVIECDRDLETLVLDLGVRLRHTLRTHCVNAHDKLLLLVIPA